MYKAKITFLLLTLLFSTNKNYGSSGLSEPKKTDFEFLQEAAEELKSFISGEELKSFISDLEPRFKTGKEIWLLLQSSIEEANKQKEEANKQKKETKKQKKEREEKEAEIKEKEAEIVAKINSLKKIVNVQDLLKRSDELNDVLSEIIKSLKKIKNCPNATPCQKDQCKDVEHVKQVIIFMELITIYANALWYSLKIAELLIGLSDGQLLVIVENAMPYFKAKPQLKDANPSSKNENIPLDEGHPPAQTNWVSEVIVTVCSILTKIIAPLGFLGGLSIGAKIACLLKTGGDLKMFNGKIESLQKYFDENEDSFKYMSEELSLFTRCRTVLRFEDQCVNDILREGKSVQEICERISKYLVNGVNPNADTERRSATFASTNVGYVDSGPLTSSQIYQGSQGAFPGYNFKPFSPGMPPQEQDLQDLNNEIDALVARLESKEMEGLDKTTREELVKLLGEQKKFMEKEVPEGQDAADWNDKLIFGQKVNEITRVVNGLTSNKLTPEQALQKIGTISHSLTDSCPDAGPGENAVKRKKIKKRSSFFNRNKLAVGILVLGGVGLCCYKKRQKIVPMFRRKRSQIAQALKRKFFQVKNLLGFAKPACPAGNEI